MRNNQLEVRDLVNILADYDLVHVPIVSHSSSGRVIGLADDYERRISIDNQASTEERREAVLHELYHVYHFLKGDLGGLPQEKVEEVIERETKSHYSKLYYPRRKKK